MYMRPMEMWGRLHVGWAACAYGNVGEETARGLGYLCSWKCGHVGRAACAYGSVGETAHELGCLCLWKCRAWAACAHGNVEETARGLMLRHVGETAGGLLPENEMKTCMCPDLEYLHWLVQ